MVAFYNEIEPYAATWIETLAARGHIAPGHVERRSVVELTPDDVGATQAHFFAGIGGWSLALRLAGWPDTVPVWTGSCPCQPFSSASRGRGGGFSSAKHLWPVWAELVEQCRPSVVFGEQVATGDGPRWLGHVADDFERLGYTFEAADLCSSLLGFAPRKRLFFAAYSDSKGECVGALDAQMARLPPLAGLAPNESPDLHRVVQEGDGFPAAMGQRRAYGNAINPRLAAVFIRAVMETLCK